MSGLGLNAKSANTIHTPNVVLMLVQRCRRWANINTTLGVCIVLARKSALINRHTHPSLIAAPSVMSSGCVAQNRAQNMYFIIL